MMAENWSNLENIIDRSYRLDLLTHLLESTRCDQLTSIEISFRNNNEADSTACDKLNALITHIHDAPSFEKIFLDRVVITTANLEALHQAAPKLEDIKLDTVFVYGDDTNALMGYSPAEKMESSSMNIYQREIVSEDDDDEEPIEPVIANWISYIGTKYTQLQYLHWVWMEGKHL